MFFLQTTEASCRIKTPTSLLYSPPSVTLSSPASSYCPDTSEDSLYVWIFLDGDGNLSVEALLRFFYSVRPVF